MKKRARQKQLALNLDRCSMSYRYLYDCVPEQMKFDALKWD